MGFLFISFNNNNTRESFNLISRDEGFLFLSDNTEENFFFKSYTKSFENQGVSLFFGK